MNLRWLRERRRAPNHVSSACMGGRFQEFGTIWGSSNPGSVVESRGAWPVVLVKSMRFSVRNLEFRMPALRPNASVVLAAFLFDEDDCPQRAVVRSDLASCTPVSPRDESLVVETVCREIRSIANNSSELRTFVASLEHASWSLTLTEPALLTASTLDQASDEISAALDR